MSAPGIDSVSLLSIDCCPRGAPSPASRLHGMVASALLLADFELVVGRAACFPYRHLDGPDMQFCSSLGHHKLDDQRDVAHAVDLCLSGPDDSSSGNGSPRSPA